MASRAAGSSPSPWISATTASSEPPSSAAAKLRPGSAGDDTVFPTLAGLQGPLSLLRLAEQHGKLRKIRVPLDQGRYRTELRERGAIEVPHGLGDARPVVVDQNRAAVNVVRGVPGQMNLADRAGLHGIEVFAGILVEVAGAHVDVVDVQQDAASGTAAGLEEELGLGNAGPPGGQIGCPVLDENPAAQR